jgi:hypothetical protein
VPVRSAGRDQFRRVLGLVVLLGFAMVSLTGCLRVHAALAVSQDDLVSGELVVAALPVNKEDDGPKLTVPPDLSDKVRTEPYTADGYVGQKVTVSGLRFTDVTQLVDSISTVQQYRMSFRRSGDLVSLAGSIDLTQVPPDRADVQIKVAFPGRISRTNGDNTDGTVTWTPKPGAVTEFNTTTQYTDSSGVSWTQWVAIVGGGAVGVALLVVLLALFTHRRTVKAERAQALARG